MAQTAKEPKYGVFVQGVEMRNQIYAMMADHPSGLFYQSDKLDTADVVVFTGGPDISPALYGEKDMACTFVDFRQDQEDTEALKRSELKYKIGICRGGQFLNVMVGGGKLWQDVDGHQKPHIVHDLVTMENVTTNSVHHQMMIPSKEGRVIAVAKATTWKDSYDRIWKRNGECVGRTIEDELDPEVILYPEKDTLCFQPHPEYAHPETRKYFYSLIDRYVLEKMPSF